LDNKLMSVSVQCAANKRIKHTHLAILDATLKWEEFKVLKTKNLHMKVLLEIMKLKHLCTLMDPSLYGIT